MKLSISNISWGAEDDLYMYSFLQLNGFEGLEIAPTRIFPECPYDRLSEAEQWASELKSNYNLVIASMQSIWYGLEENMFGTKGDRDVLIAYTKKAVLFAEKIECKNLVFGNPLNRDTDDVYKNMIKAIDFFKEIGDFALEHNTCIALEPNPIIYKTRFMNKTEQAIEMAYKIDSNGVKVNVDLGAMIYYNEDINYLKQIAPLVSHIHISEPGLELIKERYVLHSQLLRICQDFLSESFVSIEMGKQQLDKVKDTLLYVKKVTGEL